MESSSTVTVATGLKSYQDPTTGIYFVHRASYITRCPARAVDSKKRFRRAGVIPYIRRDDTIYYCLAIDAVHHQLTDFGGCVEDRETALQAATRELSEESLDIFNFRDPRVQKELHYTATVIHNHLDVIVFFVEVDCDPHSVVETYAELVRFHQAENSSLVWIAHHDLLHICETDLPLSVDGGTLPTIYSRLRDVIRYVSILEP